MKTFLKTTTALTLLFLTACAGSGVRTHQDLADALRDRNIERVSENEEAEKIASPLFEPLGYAIRVQRDEIQTYAYGSASKAEEAMEKIDNNGMPKDQPGWQWEDTPHFFRNGHFIAIYLGKDPKVTAALEEILGPQIAGAALPTSTASSSSMSVSTTSASGASVKIGTGAVIPQSMQ